MRDIDTKPTQQKYTNRGRDPNYLVRSWASGLGANTHGHKVPKSHYRSKWLRMLNHVELMQNVEVQQSLRNAMAALKAGDREIQDPESTYEFVERRRNEKCHRAVCRIRRELESSTKNSSESPQTGKHLQHSGSLSKQVSVKGNRQNRIQENLDNVDLSGFEQTNSNEKTKNNNTTIFTHNFKGRLGKTNLQSIISDEVNDRHNSITQEHNRDLENKVSLPPIPDASHDQEKGMVKNKKVKHFSLPVLEAESKFNIIRRAMEIKKYRHDFLKEQKLTSIASELHKKQYSTRKTKNSWKIDIFGDNRKMLSEETRVPEEDAPMTLPLLDSKSFSEIDSSNDFLNVKNRYNKLSPTPAVLDHKLSWPTKEK